MRNLIVQYSGTLMSAIALLGVVALAGCSTGASMPGYSIAAAGCGPHAEYAPRSKTRVARPSAAGCVGSAQD